MAIPYRTTKFKSANILAMAILGSTTKFNSRQYFQLYGYYSNFTPLSLSLSPSISLPPQLLAGASERLLGDLQLVRDPSKYRYLVGTKHTANDDHMYSEVLKSMMV